MLVSSKEANIQQGKISMESPMGQALFNREAGDRLDVAVSIGSTDLQNHRDIEEVIVPAGMCN